MTNLNIIDSVGSISSETEKLKFIALEIWDYFDRAYEDVNAVEYERQRLLPLANVLMDYVLTTERKVSDLKANLQK